jgi:hypothetical protein
METNTGKNTLESSYNLVHNIRFFHIWNYLNDAENSYEKVLITDVRDVYFNSDPFDSLEDKKLTATSEIITYESEQWNKEHLIYNLGMIGMVTLLPKPVYNVGVFGGDADLVKDMCSDIYLLSAGKPKVADQTSFNYLIQTKYKKTSDTPIQCEVETRNDNNQTKKQHPPAVKDLRSLTTQTPPAPYMLT